MELTNTSRTTKKNTLCSSRQSAIKLINQLYGVEKTSILYHQVLRNKVQDGWLKNFMLKQLLPSIQKKKETLYLFSRIMDLKPQEASSLGINGIMNECFREIEDMGNEERVDDIILQTLVVILHYELGNYRILLSYLQNLDIDFKVFILQEIIQRDEHHLDTLLAALKVD